MTFKRIAGSNLGRAITFSLSAVLFSSTVNAQSVVSVGKASFASHPPTYKARSVDNPNNGFNATKMLTRQLFVDEVASTSDGGLDVPGRPIPTNDWWTDLINNRFSGSMWSYPAMIRTSADGVGIYYPSYWADAGKEIKSRSSLTVGAVRFQADAAIATDWHDWDVVFRMPRTGGRDGEIRVTMVHGQPFTWFEYTDATPRVSFSATPRVFGSTKGRIGVAIGDDLYGIYYPASSNAEWTDGQLRLSDDTPWVVVALLTAEADLDNFAPYATSVPRDTHVEWVFVESTSTVSTTWSVDAVNLADPEGDAPVMQGFLPHAYKYAINADAKNLATAVLQYNTPRGEMKMATSTTGRFAFDYQFSGMLPYYAAPSADSPRYSSAIMDELMHTYAEGGSFGGDTYWGGKGLVQMAMNMTFAKTTGNEAEYKTSLSRLRSALVDWLTYRPGENTTFFSYYPRWGAMLGFDVSYDSDAFNDHHFHYGYFTLATALLCLEDKDFANEYGELLTMIAKDYANWDRTDRRFPFLRTLDPWCGHSWAGGLGDAGNDNGNGQESTSEAMQGWGGVYLLGVALGNDEMRDAGIFGWTTEARATREYWFDVDAPRPANAGGRQPWAGKGDRHGNYDYTQYLYAYNSNITGKGIGWWTWFGGDPLFMHGIQWMPASPALDYLSWDPDFVAWAYDDLMRGANSTFSHDWFETTINTDDESPIDPLANNDWGNVVLTYLQRAKPELAAEIFDRAWAENRHIAKSVSTSHISYFLIHSHLTHGEQDFSVHADIPTAQAYIRDGQRRYMVYNPGTADRRVTFSTASGAALKSFVAPPGRLTVFTDDAHVADIEITIADGLIVPPGETVSLSARVIDQYGAGFPGNVELTLADSPLATLNGKSLSVNAAAAKGSTFTIVGRFGDVERTLTVTVNDRPVPMSMSVRALPEMVEVGTELTPELVSVDQFGAETVHNDATWQITSQTADDAAASANLCPDRAGVYTVVGMSPDKAVTASADVFVAPRMPLISKGAKAIASSAENIGTVPENINDGDMSSRWGSNHTDDEWIILDLGADCYISRAAVTWEAAYASLYSIDIAPDGCQTERLTMNIAGQSMARNVPVDAAWTSQTTCSAQGAGTVETQLGITGRYVRVHGLKRGSQYGYSIYELELFGLDNTIGQNDIIGIDFALPVAVDQHTTLTLSPRAFTRSGAASAVQPTWSADKEADFRGNDFTPRYHGLYTLTDGKASTATVFVNEVERLNSISLDATEFTTITGQSVTIVPTPMNQFMAPYSVGLDDLQIIVTPGAEATYDIDTHQFVANLPGTYTIDFGGMETATVVVVPLSEANLALDRPATSSSSRDGNIAARAVDGNIDTRWESDWSDNHWISVDLESPYVIDRVEIVWEGAFAKSYQILTSLDESTWKEVYSTTAGKGDTEKISFDPTPAQHVRVLCSERGLPAYGNSIRELRVYGQSRYDAEENVVTIETESTQPVYYTIEGLRVSHPTPGHIYIERRGATARKIRF